jgi:hypothetical protein
MWNGREYTAIAVAGAALAAAVGVAAPASAGHRSNGYAGVYSSNGVPAFEGGLVDGGLNGTATAPAPGRAHPAQRRGPRRLE